MSERVRCKCGVGFHVHDEQTRAICPNCGRIHRRGWEPTGERVSEEDLYDG